MASVAAARALETGIKAWLEKTRVFLNKPSPVGFFGFFLIFWGFLGGFFGWVFYCQPCLKVEDSSITLLQNIQQPLPQSALLSPSVPLELLAAASSSSSFPSASILTPGSSSLASASFLSNTSSSGDSSSLSNLTNTSLASVYTVTPTTLPAAMSSVPSSAAAVNFRTGTPLLASSSSYPSFSSGMSAVSTAPNSGTGTIATAAAGSSVTLSNAAAAPPVTAAVLEDADEQISQLIRTLQQKPLSDERISRIFQQAQRTGAAAATAVSTAGGGQAGPPAVNAANLLKASLLAAKAGGGIFGDNAAAASSPAMPVLTPQVAMPAEDPPSPAAGFQNSYLDSLARSQITDKRSVSSARPRHLSSSSSSATVSGGVQTTTAAAAGGRSFHQQTPPPLLSPTGGLGGSAPRLSAAFAAASPTILQGKVTVPTVIQQNPRFDAAAPHQVAAAAPITLQTVSSGVGGVGSQIRAMQQHVQPNTRLMRGPNGQVTVQKVQTIELSQENQQVRNSVPLINKPLSVSTFIPTRCQCCGSGFIFFGSGSYFSVGFGSYMTFFLIFLT